jgi:hypothetical protein
MANRIGTLNLFASLTTDSVAAIDANTNAITGVLNNSSLGWVNGQTVDTGSANNYIVASALGVASAYNQGMAFVFVPANTNTGPSMLTVDTLAAQAIVDLSGNALVAGALRAGKAAFVDYLGSSFRLLNSAASSLLFYNTPLTGTGSTITIDCGGYSQISLLIDGTQVGNSTTWTINVTNVLWGAHFDVKILTAAAGQTYKWTGTDEQANTITPIQAWYAQTGVSKLPYASTNLIGAGDSAPAFIQYTGFSTWKSSISQASELKFSAIWN